MDTELTFERKAYICQNSTESIRKGSTSGGVFTAIAKYVLDLGGVVFGAAFDDQFHVVHRWTDTFEGLSAFRGSKYVQSHMGTSFHEVKQILDSGRWVLFTGTPCQVQGVRNYLRKAYDNLVLMDIVCYSISSPGVWEQYLRHLEKKEIVKRHEIDHIKFRDKTRYGYEYTLMTFYDKDGKELYASGPESNQMLRSFVSNTATRPSCYHCPCKSVERVSDFTVWDCYNVYQYDRSWDDNKGTSHVIVQSEKGARIWPELSKSLRTKEVDLQFAVASEPAMTECASASDDRDAFFSALANSTNGELFDRYFQDSARVKVERIARKILSKTGLYRKAKRMIKR